MTVTRLVLYVIMCVVMLCYVAMLCYVIISQSHDYDIVTMQIPHKGLLFFPQRDILLPQDSNIYQWVHHKNINILDLRRDVT